MRLVLQEAEAAVLLLVVGRAVDDHLLQAGYNDNGKSDQGGFGLGLVQICRPFCSRTMTTVTTLKDFKSTKKLNSPNRMVSWPPHVRGTQGNKPDTEVEI